jgi:hypothetical protein
MEIKIPSDLQDMFDHVVKTKFKGDEEGAIIQALALFLEHEKAHLVDEERFRLTLEKTLSLYRSKRDRAESEFQDAFSKLAKKKTRATEIFNSFTKGKGQ